MRAGRQPPARSRRMRRGTGISLRWLGMRPRKRAEAVAVGEGNALGRHREGDGRFRPGEQPCGLEPPQGRLEPLGGQAGEPLELAEAEAAGQGGGPAASPRPHLPGGEPDAEIDQADEFLVVGPPGQGQADGRDELIAALGFGRRNALRRCERTRCARGPPRDVKADADRQVRRTREAGSPWGEKAHTFPAGKSAAFPPAQASTT